MGFQSSNMPAPQLRERPRVAYVPAERVGRIAPPVPTPPPVEIVPPKMPDDDGNPGWFRNLVSNVAARYGASYDEVMGKRRSVFLARQAAMKAVVEAMPRLSYSQIAHLFKRDHTSLLYAIGRTKSSRLQAAGMRPPGPSRARKPLGSPRASTHKIPDEIAREIAALMRSPNAPPEKVAAHKYGVARSTLQRIKYGLRRDRNGVAI